MTAQKGKDLLIKIDTTGSGGILPGIGAYGCHTRSRST